MEKGQPNFIHPTVVVEFGRFTYSSLWKFMSFIYKTFVKLIDTQMSNMREHINTVFFHGPLTTRRKHLFGTIYTVML